LSSHSLFLIFLPLLGIGIIIGIAQQTLAFVWSARSKKREFSPKLENALLQASKYQPKIRNVPLKFLDEPDFTACVIGWKKPFILLNPKIIDELEISEISALLLHEYAHIQRKDHLFSYLSSLLKSFLFFLPLAHFFHYLFVKGRERNADRLVSYWMGTPLPLAQALLKAARLSPSYPYLNSAFWKKSISLKERIEGLLNDKISFPFKNFLISIALSILLFLIALSPTMASETISHCQTNQCIKSLPCCQHTYKK
jgi:beta-lactamase regulating signal transducer with metallopeptidase domain